MNKRYTFFKIMSQQADIQLETDWEFLLRMCDKMENLQKEKPELFEEYVWITIDGKDKYVKATEIDKTA